jgi:hypothetical protein
MDLLYPEFWAASFDELDMGEYGFQNLVSRDVEPLVANFGTKVNVPIQPDMDAETWTPGDAISASDIAQTEVEVSLNKSYKKTINLNGTEMSKSAYDLVQTYGVPMAKSIMKSVNDQIYLELLSSTEFLDATSGIDEDDVIDAGATLTANDVSMADRAFIGSPDVIAALQKQDAFQYVNYSGQSDVMTNGRLMRRMGFDFYVNNSISKYTPADVAGAVNNGAGYSAGDSTLAVDAFDDDTNPLRVGDMIKFADHSADQFYTITATDTTGDDTTEITISPALVESVADNEVINVTASQSALAMVPSGLAFAARAYSQLPANTGVSQSVLSFNGLPIRISVWHDAKLGVNVQYDILFGASLVKSERVVRIIEDL